MLGAMMFASKVALDLLPNIHLIGVFICAITIVFRKKALWPIYVFVFITGLVNGFATWWIPYLYIWTLLWVAVMLLPRNAPPIVYIIVCSLHGFLFGVLYSPAQALLFGLNFKSTLAWIAAGLPYDAIHGVSNFICGFLIAPLAKLLQTLKEKYL